MIQSNPHTLEALKREPMNPPITMKDCRDNEHVITWNAAIDAAAGIIALDETTDALLERFPDAGVYIYPSRGKWYCKISAITGEGKTRDEAIISAKAALEKVKT